MSIEIQEISFTGETDAGGVRHDYVWRAGMEPEDIRGGSDEGQILVRIDVDGQVDIVYSDLRETGDVAAIDRAINALQRIRDGLATAYRGQNDPGVCLERGGWGRCRLMHGHEGEHRLPTEEEWQARYLSSPRSVAS
jgi:hypothetical protein